MKKVILRLLPVLAVAGVLMWTPGCTTWRGERDEGWYYGDERYEGDYWADGGRHGEGWEHRESGERGGGEGHEGHGGHR